MFQCSIYSFGDILGCHLGNIQLDTLHLKFELLAGEIKREYKSQQLLTFRFLLMVVGFFLIPIK